MPWGMGDLAHDLGFERVIELDWWEGFAHKDWRVTLTPSKHWGARTLRDHHRGYGGFILEHQGRRVYHAGDSAYFDGFAVLFHRPGRVMDSIGIPRTPEVQRCGVFRD